MSKEVVDYYDENRPKIYLRDVPCQILEETSNLKIGGLSERKTCGNNY